ncbi:MAG TPA: dUTP diphosphatase [Bacillota bacterium]|nr:dUTP diphosphatase [Bacillota bacterium]
MDWHQLFNMQKKLDTYIETKRGIADQDVFSEKCLALLTELGELANETRCFKFWSTKERSEQAVILEEYVDGIHFILSLGLDKGYGFTKEDIPHPNLSEIEQFHAVFAASVAFKNEPTEANYKNMFISYLQLGKLLGFSEGDIQRAYMEKNAKNYQRQNEGY